MKITTARAIKIGTTMFRMSPTLHKMPSTVPKGTPEQPINSPVTWADARTGIMAKARPKNNTIILFFILILISNNSFRQGADKRPYKLIISNYLIIPLMIMDAME